MFTNPQALTKVRVLVVENELIQAKGIENDLNYLSEDEKHEFGIIAFEVHYASSVVEAERLLMQAKADNVPYHLLFLDLGLPLNTGEPERPPEGAGLRVLNCAHRSSGAMQIIVVSKFSDFQMARNAFLGGALDFIAKPFKREVLQFQAKNSFKRILSNQCDRLLEKRLHELFPYHIQMLAYRFGTCFSSLTQDVVHEAEQLKEELGERLGLDVSTDSQDSLLRHLDALSVAVRKSKHTWADLQSMLPKSGEEPQRLVVEELLRELLPCLTVKQVEFHIPPGQETDVLSFHQDVRVIFKELILGALCELPNYSGPEHRLELMITTTQEYAQVTFSGGLFHFDEQTKLAIAKGQRQNDRTFGQAWGLSVAQHIALRGGGRLQIGSPEQPDSVSYFIPLARHA